MRRIKTLGSLFFTFNGCHPGGEGGGGRVSDSRVNFCRFNLLWHFWPCPGHLWSENPPEIGQKHPVTRKFMLRATQNMLKCKNIVKKWFFAGFGHVGKMAIF